MRSRFSIVRSVSSFTYACQKTKGFTLIELLVSIAIIAVVFGAVITSNNVIQRNSRDAQRQSDLRTLQGALEQYHADNFVYPTSIPSSGSFTSDGKTYLNKIPTPPSGNNYIYSYSPLPAGCDNTTIKCTNYCILASLEGGGTTPTSPCPTPAGYNFQVTQP